MKKWVLAGLALSLAVSGQAAAAPAPETSHLVFVKEFVRELGTTAGVMEQANQQLQQDSSADEKLRDELYAFTSMRLELKTNIGELSAVVLAPPYDTLAPSLVSLYQKKEALVDRFIASATNTLGGPQPGVDYNKMLARLTQLRATIDYIDKTIFDATVLVFSVLIDDRPDSGGHVSRLIITRSEREGLLADINSTFGANLDEKNANYTISSAQLLRAYLLKDWKSSDDPK